MHKDKSIEDIDIKSDPSIAEIIEKCYIAGRNLCIKLKKPKEAKVVATIKDDYTLFRKEIEKLLKEKQVSKEDTRIILNLIDDNHTVIYKDDNDNDFDANDEYNNADNKKEKITSIESDLSDPSDLKDLEIIKVSDCLKLHRGKVKVKGNIEGISESYDLVSEVTYVCNCGENIKSFIPPLFTLPKDRNDCRKCYIPLKIDKDLVKYKCAITIHLQDKENFNDLDKLTCILQDIDTKKIKIGEQVIITGDVHVLPKSNKNYTHPHCFC